MSSVEQQTAQQITREQAIANLKQTEDPGARYYAAWWLGKFRVSDREAIEALILALTDEVDRTPDGGYPLRRNAATALGKLGNNSAVPALIDCLECEDYYVRESAAQALEMLGDSRAIPDLGRKLAGGVEAATGVPGKPYLKQPYEAIIEALGTLGATEAIDSILPFLDHPTEKVRYAAARSLYQLTKEPKYAEVLMRALEGKELQLRRSALMDLGAIDYLGAADAIAATFAENSLKLVALKGLLENHLKDREPNRDTWRVLSLMDDLL